MFGKDIAKTNPVSGWALRSYKWVTKYKFISEICCSTCVKISASDSLYKLPSMENRGQADRVTTPAHAELCHARLTTVATETYYYGHQSLLKTPQWIVTSKRLH